MNGKKYFCLILLLLLTGALVIFSPLVVMPIFLMGAMAQSGVSRIEMLGLLVVIVCSYAGTFIAWKHYKELKYDDALRAVIYIGLLPLLFIFLWGTLR